MHWLMDTAFQQQHEWFNSNCFENAPPATVAWLTSLQASMQVEAQFTTEDKDAFNRLDSLHIWTDSFLAQRLGQKQQPITALLLRVWQFEEAVTVPQDNSYWGCFSRGALHNRMVAQQP
jgi:hypothetical protein